MLHNNVRSLRRNLENLQVHLLDELNYSFSVIGVSETKISTVDCVNFDTSIPGYKFEYVPTPLSSGGVGMYVKDNLNYTIIDKTSNEAFQALWIEFHLSRQPNSNLHMECHPRGELNRALTVIVNAYTKLMVYRVFTHRASPVSGW